MSPSQHSGNESTTARLLGSGTSGILELLGFHPVDTVAKRLMNNKLAITPTHTYSNIIFKDAHSLSIARKYLSLFPGLGAAAGYKVLQRMYKFGGQPYVKDYLQKNHLETFNSLVGQVHAKTIINATAGSIIGIGEVALLPLDALKIKMQVASASSKKGAIDIFREEGWNLYRGTGWTVARNAPGSFALFGGSAATKQYLFKLEDNAKASFLQDTVCSAVGAIASITLSAPLGICI
jgi:hypothetical protein